MPSPRPAPPISAHELRKLIWPILLAASLLAGTFFFLQPAGAAATITVTTTSDLIAEDGLCSLREAVIAANADNPFQGCSAGSGADTIIFGDNLPTPATFSLTIAGTNEDNAQTGDLDIAGTLTITGKGEGNTLLDGNGIDRVLEARPGSRLTLSGVTVSKGNPGSGVDGGGILVGQTGHFSATNTLVIGNTAFRGGGIKVLGVLVLENSSVNANLGGGISNDGGRLVLTNVQVTNNSGGYGIRNQTQGVLTFNSGLVSGNQGGGIYNTTSTATLTNLTISSNTSGGGVYNTGNILTRVTISHSLVISNTGTNGGGIANLGIGGTAYVYDSSVRGNVASVAGGGLFNNGVLTVNSSSIYQNQARTGGGIDQSGGYLYLTNDTLGGNMALDTGGGLCNRRSAVLTNVTLNANTASGIDTGGNIFVDTSEVSLKNTIVANSDLDGNCFNSGGAIHSLGYNLDDGNTCGFTATGDLTNTDPLLGPLQDNGGPTLTHALLAGSLAIDAGTNSGCPPKDQRGAARPVDGDGTPGAVCDMGSYEYLGMPPPPPPIFKIYQPLILRT